jgi:hypothetical protein
MRTEGFRRLFFIFLFLLLPVFAYSLPPQADDAGELLKRVVANLRTNDLKAQNYTFVEDYHNVNYDKNGKIKVDGTAKYETVFIEGTPYKRKIEEDGKPLSGKAAAEEEKKYQATVAERRRMNAEQKQTLFHREYRITTKPEDWPDLFLVATGGKETVDGHETIKLVLTPRIGIKPTSEAQKDELHTSIELWIDQSDEHPLHLRRQYTSDGIHMLRGGTVDLFWQKEPKDGIYLLAHALIQYKVKYLLTTIPGMTEQHFSNYRRFGVDVHITTEPVQPN